MSTTRRMGTGWTRRYVFDFSKFAELRYDGALLTGTPAVEEVGTSALTLASPTILTGSKKVGVTVSGGASGATYLLRCTCGTDGGATLTISGNLEVADDADLA